MRKTLKQLDNSNFIELSTSVSSIINKYIKIENITGTSFFYVLQENNGKNCFLMRITKKGFFENIGHILPINKQYFSICFIYQGFEIIHRIKFSDVKILTN